MRILHIVRGLANSSGTTHIVGPLSEAQARLGHSVRVFFVDKPGRRPVLPDSSLVESRGFAMTVESEHIGWSRSFARALPAAVQSAHLVHIHGIWNFPTLWAMRAASRAGVPYIVAPQGSLEEWALNRRQRAKSLYATLVEKPYFDRATAIQALTEAEAVQCRRFGIRAPVTILPNGVDLSAIDRHAEAADLRAEFSLPRDSIVSLFLSRIFPKKGLDLLIPAFAKLATIRSDVFLFIVGDDAGSGYRLEIKELARRYGVAQRVHFLGELSGQRKLQVLRGADVYVLPSYSEGLPVAALEAMACRRPVVLTKNCNLNEIERRDAGWLIDARIDSLLDALQRACASEAERQRRGDNGRVMIAERYTWDRIAEESIRTYLSHRGRIH